jgi:hypothetical protein
MNKHSDYRVVAATGVFGGLNPIEGHIIFYTDRFEPTSDNSGKMSLGSINRELQVEIHLSPVAFKSISEWMTKQVKDFETREKQQIGTAKLGEPPPRVYG